VYASDAALDNLDEVDLQVESKLDEAELKRYCKQHGVLLELSRTEKLARLHLIHELHQLRRKRVLDALDLSQYTDMTD
jgi:hypothetical protein